MHQAQNRAVRHDHALGFAGRAGGVHDVGRVVATGSLEHSGIGSLRRCHEIRQIDQRPIQVANAGESSLFCDDELGQAIGNDEIELRPGIGRIQRHIDGSQTQDRQDQSQRVPTARNHDGAAVASLQSHTVQDGSKTGRTFAERGITFFTRRVDRSKMIAKRRTSGIEALCHTRYMIRPARQVA
ncbi:hypothetical protein R69746_06097 [Paraburkholderia aspalathi]|nr:hypothetical protein R69746_06097 [Paraburkholderia aspalathi]